MEVKAKLNRLRISPRKVRLVIDVIRGMDALEAVDQLKFMNKGAALPIKKLVESAMANAEHNSKLEKTNLFIKKITVNESVTLKRWKPRAMGRATPIRKRSSIVDIVLGEKVASKKKAETAEKKTDKKDIKIVKADEIKNTLEKDDQERSEKKGKSSGKGLGKFKEKFSLRKGE